MPPNPSSGCTAGPASNQWPDWFRARSYRHFDAPGAWGSLVGLADDPARVAKHAFFPFLHFVSEQRRFRKNQTVRFKKKKRPIMFASHRDSAIFSRYAKLLSDEYEKQVVPMTGVSDAVIAYRRLGKSTVDFAGEVFKFVTTKETSIALCFDLSDFFGTIPHDALKKAWAQLLGMPRLPDDHHAVFKAITKYSFVDIESLEKLLGLDLEEIPRGRPICTLSDFRQKVRKEGLITPNPTPGCGIPQGSPISAFLANLLMLETDKIMVDFVGKLGGLYRRYSDDILIVCPPEDRDTVTAELEKHLLRLGLKTNEKVDQAIFTTVDGVLRSDKRLQYLGLTFDGRTVLIRDSSLARFNKKLRMGVRAARHGARARKRPVHKRRIYENYSHLGRRNFISYTRRVAERLEAMGLRAGRGIRSQVASHMRTIRYELERELSEGRGQDTIMANKIAASSTP